MKSKMLLLCVISCVALTGCSLESAKNKKDEMLNNYLLHDNEEYNKYISNSDLYKDKMDDNGYYEDPDIDLTSHSDMIHVSFASNSLLSVTYYNDSECKEKIDENNCFINPGETIYAKVDSTSNVQSNTYEFRGFKIAGFDGEKSNFNYYSCNGNKIDIPEDIQYKDISIIPDGAYKSRKLSFKAEFKDNDGNTISLSPLWTINVGDQSYSTKSDGYSVESGDVFRVMAKYDAKEYYLIDDEVEPKFESFKEDSGTGTVMFKQYDAQSAVDNYKLVLGKKFDIKIDSVSATAPVEIYIDGEKTEADFPLISSAKLGAEVRIESKGTITSVGNTKNLTRLTNNGYVYAVYNESEAFEFDPDNYVFTNGKVIFYDSDHNEISKLTSLNIGDVIYYTGQPKEGYTFNMGNDERKLTVDSNIEYILKNELKFVQKQKVDLPQPEKGGKIIYCLNGKTINDDKAYFAAGTDKLTANFEPVDRYKVDNLSDGAECVVSTSDHRIYFIDNDGEQVAIENVFSLSSTQKANLTILLDDSVGTEIKFNVYNGTSESINAKKSYVSKKAFDSISNPFGVDDNKIIDNQKVETVSVIKIAVSDWSALANEALRIDVLKTNSSKKKTTEIYYIKKGSGFQIIKTDSGESDYYTDIDIKISKVSGIEFNSKDYWYDNGQIQVSYEDTSAKEQLKDGDFVEKSRKICITLKANEGFKLSQIDNTKWNPLTKFYKDIEQYTVKCNFEKINEKLTEIKNKTRIS